MPRLLPIVRLSVFLASGIAPAAGAAAATDFPSPRNASYTIAARLDAAARTLDGHQVLRWRNVQARSTDRLFFHLYWNAWRNDQSTWMREDRYRGRSDLKDDIGDGDWGFQQIESIRLLEDSGGPLDLTGRSAFVAPDDGNDADRTLLRVDLPRQVAPGETIEVEIDWRARVPRTVARTGFRGEFFLIAHWFPQVAVYEPEGWRPHQFHSATEFFSDYGVYDVRLTLPGRFVVGATGREVGTRELDDGMVRHRFVQEDVHTFAWTASPDFLVFEDRFESPGLPPVDLRLLLQPHHRRQRERHFAAAKAALERYGNWFGPYPFAHLTLVDPAYGSGAGGMEYPTFFTCGTRLFNPLGSGRPEYVTIHETGHQFWYGVVGSNEVEHAWIDEGFDSFADARVYDEVYGRPYYTKRYFRPPGFEAGDAFFPRLFEELPLSREIYGNRLERARSAAESDLPGRPTWRLHPETAAGISYSWTAAWLHTLERYLGWENLQPILAAFYQRYRFAHPRPDDFFALAAELAGQDLEWFFDQVVRQDHDFDYAIESVESRETAPRGLVDAPGGPVPAAAVEEPRTYRNEVVVRRLGSGTFPVDVRMVFEDGSEVRRRWDGLYRWKLFVEERAAPLDYAEVDPDRVLLLDASFVNNSLYRRSQDAWPAVKWASRWMAWLQDLLTTYAWFA